MKPPYAIGAVPSLSGHAIAYRWRSLPRVRRHRASKLQGSSERVLPWQITMDQLIFASLSPTHYYWYEVGMLKVPATSAATSTCLTSRINGMTTQHTHTQRSLCSINRRLKATYCYKVRWHYSYILLLLTYLTTPVPYVLLQCFRSV